MDLKKGLALVVVCSFLLVGCASREERQAEYAGYLQANQQMYREYMESVKGKPLVKFKGTDSGGQPLEFEVNQNPQAPAAQQMQQDQEAIAWINFAGVALNGVTNVGGQFVNAFFNSQNQKYMWQGIGNMSSGGIKVDSGGGNVSLSNVGLIGSMKSGDGSPISTTGFNFYNLDGENAIEGLSAGSAQESSSDRSEENGNSSTETTTTN